MKTAKLFQDVIARLSKKFRFGRKGWDALLRSLHTFSEDFMETRAQPEQQNREDIL